MSKAWNKQEYAEKLRDPRWQEKRLKIIKRDKNRCVICKMSPDIDPETILHVHHTFYIDGWEPWEYPDYSLRTLCSDHHEIEKEEKKKANKRLNEVIKECGFISTDVWDLAITLDYWSKVTRFTHNIKLIDALDGALKLPTPEELGIVMVKLPTYEEICRELSPIERRQYDAFLASCDKIEEEL